jgi:NADH-ubiquinone oxidoreductase subunit 10
MLSTQNEYFHACIDKVVAPSQKKSVYYHRRYRRVPTIDECTVNDPLCYFEANEQFKRDRLVIHVSDQFSLEFQLNHLLFLSINF